jgi:hypothetical protein
MKGKKPKGRKPSAARGKPAAKAPRADHPAGYVAVHSSILERRVRKGDVAPDMETSQLIRSIAAYGRKHRDFQLLVPVGSTLLLGCDDTSGTCTATINSADVAILAGLTVISFLYTFGGAGGCNCADLDEVHLTVGGGPLRLSAGALAELDRVPIPLAPGQKRWTGKVTPIGAAGAGIAVGVAVTIDAFFKCSTRKFCHTCTPSPVKATANVVVK